MKSYIGIFINAAVGVYLLNVSEPSWFIQWTVIGFYGLLALGGFICYAGLASFWKVALGAPEVFGPGKENHKVTKEMYSSMVKVIGPYADMPFYVLSVVASVLLLAGILQHSWYMLFGVLFAAVVFGYAVIQSLLASFSKISALATGE